VAVAVLAELWWFKNSLKKWTKKVEKSWKCDSGGVQGDVVKWGVAVDGWEWCQSIEEIKAVRLVVVREWQWQY
jgi:hypothetical protein